MINLHLDVQLGNADPRLPDMIAAFADLHRHLTSNGIPFTFNERRSGNVKPKPHPDDARLYPGPVSPDDDLDAPMTADEIEASIVQAAMTAVRHPPGSIYNRGRPDPAPTADEAFPDDLIR